MTNVGLFFHTPFFQIFFVATKIRIGRGALFFAATKNRIGRRPRGTAGTGTTPAAFYLGLCRLRGLLPPPASHDYAVGGPFFFAATKIRAGRGTRCRHGRCKRAIPHCSNDRNRRNHSSLRQRRIESDADHVGRQGLAPLRSFTIYSVNYFYFCSSDYICSMERNGMVWFWIYI